MSTDVRVRFAPSPTGYLHVGGARTALFNYLFAKHTGGTFVLRIEDTDRTRYVEGAVKEIFDSLRWLGLSWDEGPDVGGTSGPYVQSERLDIYKKRTQDLLDSDAAYRCFCTPQRLEEVRLAREKAKMLTGYDRHCRDLSKEEERRLLDGGAPFVVRFKVPAGRSVVFLDMIRGAIEYKTEVLDDLVILKSDGFPTYHLANVVDDHEMKISHVLRGDEWISSTPRHVLLYEAFGWTPPHFAHMPVILDPSGGKLSKRKGAASVMDYKNRGILSDALFNFLALLGWSPGGGDEREKMSRQEIINAFSLEKISPKSAVLDEKKLDWMNGLYMAESTAERLAPDVCKLWKEKGVVTVDRDETDPYLLGVIRLFKDRSKRVTEIADNAVYFFKDPDDYEPKAVQKHFKPETVLVLRELMENIGSLASFGAKQLDALYHDYAARTGISVGELVHPTRLAVSGVSFGPGLFEMMELLGKDAVMRRMDRAIETIRT
jgi:glutamyl-tRNA synthetase